jgi:hypothetical protein
MSDTNAEKRKVATDAYLATIDSLEPDIASIDPGAFYASAAISLKRIADSLDIIKKLMSANLTR